MTHYFTREEAEALLPQIAEILRTIQEERRKMRTCEADLNALKVQAMGNGHHLQERIVQAQHAIAEHIRILRAVFGEFQTFGCELKDPDTGLIDFLSLRAGQEIYLCWQLGEERIAFWHYLHTGFAGRQPLD
ncbi:MAG TPA: DUF2203 domain-containing protein [Ktedonobacteraceae bacterium]|jgi:hypothetical protein